MIIHLRFHFFFSFFCIMLFTYLYYFYADFLLFIICFSIFNLVFYFLIYLFFYVRIRFQYEFLNFKENYKYKISYNNKCSICLNKINTDNKIILPCKHKYHYNCLINFINFKLLEDSNYMFKCPLCLKYHEIIKKKKLVFKIEKRPFELNYDEIDVIMI